MKKNSLNLILKKIHNNQEVNLTQFVKIIESLPLSNHRFSISDIKSIKNPRTGLSLITDMTPNLKKELQKLNDHVGTDRNSAAHQNLSHDHKVDGSFILIRQSNQHPCVVTIHSDSSFTCPVPQSKNAIIYENRQLFLHNDRFKLFLDQYTEIPNDQPMDVLFGAGNELANSLHKNFLSRYDVIYLCMDMDLGGLRMANNLMRLMPNQKIKFIQPYDIRDRLERVICGLTQKQLSQISNFAQNAHPDLIPYFKMIRDTGRTIEQESFL